jgi:hypothetical protein
MMILLYRRYIAEIFKGRSVTIVPILVGSLAVKKEAECEHRGLEC